MKRLLLIKFYFAALMCFIGTHQMHAQADIEYTFDGTTWEGWTAQSGTGAFVSVFANSNPNDALNVSWPNVGANTRNVIMYGPAAVATMDADTYKFFQIKVSNTSSEIGTLRLRARTVAGGSFFNVIDVPINQDTAGSFSTYDIEVTNASYTGALDRFQIVFRSASNAILSANANTDAILVDNILVSASNTLSADRFNKNNLEVYISYGKLNVPKASEYKIYNIMGAVAKEGQGSRAIDVSDLSSGIYIYKTEEGFAKFVK